MDSLGGRVGRLWRNLDDKGQSVLKRGAALIGHLGQRSRSWARELETSECVERELLL